MQGRSIDAEVGAWAVKKGEHCNFPLPSPVHIRSPLYPRQALRRCYFADQKNGAGSAASIDADDEETYEEMEAGYIRSLSASTKWDAKGGKSGATFSKSADGRFVVKYISKTELQMFTDCALRCVSVHLPWLSV